jgi:Domain of unknown function (DUF4214)/Methyltransferase domain
MSTTPNLQAVLRCQNTQFVEAAYQTILNRPPDVEGFNYYLARLHSGVRKIQILSELSASPEAHTSGMDLPGLRDALRRQKFAKIPLVGGIFRFCCGLEGDSPLEVRSRVAEQQTFFLKDELSGISQRQVQLETQQAQLETKLPSLLRPLADLSRRQLDFETRQLPTLLQTLSELNHRQLASDNDRDNLVKSVPVALRKIARDLVEVRMMDQQVSAVRDRLESESGSMNQHVVEIREKLKNSLHDVEYLLGRIEFVRRELMFEMRYGASVPPGEHDRLNAGIKIMSPEKLSVARNERIRLNLGCGHIALGGYLNVDRRALPGVDIVAEVDDLPFTAGEVDEIFSAHLIEHFPQEQLRRNLLNYWRDLLKPGGQFRVVAPDAEGMMNAYNRGEYAFERLREVTFGAQDYDGDFHFNMLNTSSLIKLLAEASFTDIRVIAENRENGGCKEFEVVARRPERKI